MHRILTLSVLMVLTMVYGGMALPVNAASPLPSTSPISTQTASQAAETIRQVKQRIEKLIQEPKPTETSSLVGLVGSVVKVGSSTFTVTDDIGNEHTIQINAETEIWQKKTKLALKDLPLQTGVTVYAIPLDNNVYEAKRVVIQEEVLVEHRKVWLGTIHLLDATKLTFTIRGDMPEQTWVLGRPIIYEDSVNTTITPKQIQADSAALVITNEASPGKTTVSRIHLLVPIRKDVL